MPSLSHSNEKPAPPRIASTTRLEAFSDAVFAIVSTLLILEMHVPELDTHHPFGLETALVQQSLFVLGHGGAVHHRFSWRLPGMPR